MKSTGVSGASFGECGLSRRFYSTARRGCADMSILRGTWVAVSASSVSLERHAGCPIHGPQSTLAIPCGCGRWAATIKNRETLERRQCSAKCSKRCEEPTRVDAGWRTYRGSGFFCLGRQTSVQTAELSTHGHYQSIERIAPRRNQRSVPVAQLGPAHA